MLLSGGLVLEWGLVLALGFSFLSVKAEREDERGRAGTAACLPKAEVVLMCRTFHPY